MNKCLATIIIPTTGNRGTLLQHSIKSIQNQTIQDFEVCVIGDGVEQETKAQIKQISEKDPRILFFDFPKHQRRGEPYRHRVIQESRGDYIFYLCDRDLMFPNHLETLLKWLKRYNFVSSTFVDVRRDQSLRIGQYISYFGAGSESEASPSKAWISLSNVGHSRYMYDLLKFGWRTTPKEQFTDIYMWEQFLAHPMCNPYSLPTPTILYFKRGNHPGDPVEARAQELAVWSEKISASDGPEEIMQSALAAVLIEHRRLCSFWIGPRFRVFLGRIKGLRRLIGVLNRLILRKGRVNQAL